MLDDIVGNFCGHWLRIWAYNSKKTNLDESLGTFLMVLDICKDKSVNLKVINKKWWTNKADELILDEIQYLGANSWHDWL